MLSMRLTCILALAGAFGFGVATVACTQQAAATPERGDDDDSAGDDDTSDDDDSTTKKDAASSSGSTTTSSSSSGSILPVDSGPPPKSAMTFFITSTPASAGADGNLGGLDGADKKCLELATAAKAGDHTWKAFLSITGTNAKDRIGKGPWKNQKGEVVAADIDSLLDSTLHPVADSVFVDEKGAVVPPTGRLILTGSLANGTPNLNRNCNGWTSNQNNQAAGYGDTTPIQNPNAGANWAFAKGLGANNNSSSNCTAAGIKASKSEARIACFATD